MLLLLLQAHEQLRAVLLTLLEELPSDLPILLLGTSLIPLAEIDGNPHSVFPQRTVYVLVLSETAISSNSCCSVFFKYWG